VRRLRSLIFLLAMALALTTTAAYADDGSGCRYPQPYVEQLYGDTAR
jgi:hypothetical protein